MPCSTSSGISGRFQPLFPGRRQIIHVLLTLAPLYGVAPIPFDLHASSTPSAFDLNQDQILIKFNLWIKNYIVARSLLSQRHSHKRSLLTLLFFHCQVSSEGLCLPFFASSFLSELTRNEAKNIQKKRLFEQSFSFSPSFTCLHPSMIK